MKTNTTAALIQRIKDALPPRAAGIRTEYSVDQNGANRRAIVIEAFGRKNHHILVSPYDRIRERAAQLMRDNVGANPEKIHDALEAAHELSEINDVGAWPLVEDRREPRQMSQHGIGPKSYKNFPGAEDLWLSISSNLPSIERIEIKEAIDGEAGRPNSRKSYGFFYDRAGNQVAAIHLNVLSRAVRDMSFPQNEEDRRNADRRTGRWAHQVGADQREFMAAMIALLSIDNYYAPTEILL